MDINVQNKTRSEELMFAATLLFLYVNINCH